MMGPPLYRGMDRAQLDAAYNNAAAVGNERRATYFAEWATRNRAINKRARIRRNLRYGQADRNRIDFFEAEKRNSPTLVFIHGGNWHMGDKEDFDWIATGPLSHDVNFASVEYDLAPSVQIDGIVAEIRTATSWIVQNLCSEVYLSGHSAGGHLAAMAMDVAGVKAVIPISGLFDLEPIRLCFLNESIRLDEAAAQRNSPIRIIPPSSPPVIIAVGGDELPEMHRQSQSYFDALRGQKLAARYVSIPGRDHLSVLEELGQPDGKIFECILASIGAARA